MIILENATKISKVAGNKTRQVLSSASLTLPSNRRIALLGPSLQDKRILIDVLAGTVLVTGGRIIRKTKTSFRVGDLLGFEGKAPLRTNVAYVARLYGMESWQILRFVEEVLDIGEFIDRPFNELPTRLRRPLGQVIGLAIPFDLYLMGEDKMRGEEILRKKCWALFEARHRTSGMIIPTSDNKFTREYCDMAMVLNRGQLTLHESINEGLAIANELRSKDD